MALRISTPSRRPSNEGTDSSPKGQSAGGSRRRDWAPCRELVDEQKSEFRHVKMFMSVLTLSTRSHLTRSRPPHRSRESFSGEEEEEDRHRTQEHEGGQRGLAKWKKENQSHICHGGAERQLSD